MIAEQWSESCGPSDADLFAEPVPERRPIDIRGQHVTKQQWADVETIDTGEWL